MKKVARNFISKWKTIQKVSETFIHVEKNHQAVMSFFAERIVMTPKKKTSNSTTLKMERKKIVAKSDGSNVHIAGGTNAGIVVNKQQSQDQDDIWANIGPHLCLEFRVSLINTSTKRYTQEKRST